MSALPPTAVGAGRGRGRGIVSSYHMSGIAAPGGIQSPSTPPPKATTTPPLNDAFGVGRAMLGRGRGALARCQTPPAAAAPVLNGRGLSAAPVQIGHGPSPVLNGHGYSAAPALVRDAPGASSLAMSSLQSALISTSAPDVGIGRGATRGLMRPDRSFLQQVARTRPVHIQSKKGTTGSPIALYANYFALKQKPNWTLLLYRVDVTPEEDRIGVKKSLVRSLIPKIGLNIFDGTMMFTLTRLDPDPLVLTVMKLPPRGTTGEGTPCNVTFKLVREVGTEDVTYIHVMNIILRKGMQGLNLEEIRRDYFDPEAKIDLPKWKIQIWPGYKTSIRQHEHSLLLCCDTTCKVLRLDTVYDQIRDILAKTKNDKDAVFKQLLGQIVMTKYNRKTYKIDNVIWEKSPSDYFLGRNGEEIPFERYYREKYCETIKDLKQPLLMSKPRDRIRRQEGGSQEERSVLLVPELCMMTGLSEEQKSNFQLMKDLGSHTRAAPPKRIETLLKFGQRIMQTEECRLELRNWGVKFSETLQEIPGRLFAPEKILQGNPRANCSYRVDNAEWNFRDCKLLVSGTCTRWAIIYPTRDEKETVEFLDCLNKSAVSLGFQMGAPKHYKIPDNRTSSYIMELAKIIPMKPDMVMVVVPNNMGDAYHAVKKICCVDNAVPSQVVTGTVLRKKNGMMSIATKVAIQMASKLGAEPWALNIPLSDTMIIGYDSYHDTASANKSIGAVVSTVNNNFTRFYSTSVVHSNNEELHAQMKQSIVMALRAYRDYNNGTLPQRIIIYRDGVGDGQLEYVKDTEIESIRGVLRENYETLPKFCYIIVSKRINTRFFHNRPGQAAANPPSGTVIDDVVTLPERYDFFLVSQSVREGTVNPTSYNVLVDESGLTPDRIQQLSYKLCHLYYNWQGTVRVPHVCQYAHKLAFLVGNSLHKVPHQNLNHLLYYL